MKKQSCFVVLLMMLLLFPSGAFAQQQMIKGHINAILILLFMFFNLII